jgi:hypothetical protein
MPANHESLLTGRNAQPLNEAAVLRIFYVFRGLDPDVSVRHDPDQRTAFCVTTEPGGGETAEIRFGNDIKPGAGVLDPNSTLSVQAAAAHELSHYHRWNDGSELTDENLRQIDEALTSLDAVLRFQNKLSEFEVRQLVADAIQRLQLYVQGLGP